MGNRSLSWSYETHPTLYKPLMSVDIETHEPYKATVERSDPTALPAARCGHGSCCGNGSGTRNP